MSKYIGICLDCLYIYIYKCFPWAGLFNDYLDVAGPDGVDRPEECYQPPLSPAKRNRSSLPENASLGLRAGPSTANLQCQASPAGGGPSQGQGPTRNKAMDVRQMMWLAGGLRCYFTCWSYHDYHAQLEKCGSREWAGGWCGSTSWIETKSRWNIKICSRGLCSPYMSYDFRKPRCWLPFHRYKCNYNFVLPTWYDSDNCMYTQWLFLFFRRHTVLQRFRTSLCIKLVKRSQKCYRMLKSTTNRCMRVIRCRNSK